MKNKILFTVFTFLLFSSVGFSQYSDDYEKIGLPGDNLNLYATLKIFQESETLEIFEKKLNDNDLKINNLDLNGDNQIDYIRVFDNVKNNVHFITLQVAISKTETQDVAVIIVQNYNNKIQIQVIGDENLYGKDYIIEPNMIDENGNAIGNTPNPGYIGQKNANNSSTVIVNNYTYSDLYGWPLVRYIYTPSYVVWQSPWYWGYYPTYWHPWNPYYWDFYWGYHYHWNEYYRAHYRHGHQNRYSGWNDYYVHNKHESPIVTTKIQQRDYKTTYSRPDMAEKGSEAFIKKYPDSPYSKRGLPENKNFDKQNNSNDGRRINNVNQSNEKRNEYQNNNKINKTDNNQNYQNNSRINKNNIEVVPINQNNSKIQNKVINKEDHSRISNSEKNKVIIQNNSKNSAPQNNQEHRISKPENLKKEIPKHEKRN